MPVRAQMLTVKLFAQLLDDLSLYLEAFLAGEAGNLRWQELLLLIGVLPVGCWPWCPWPCTAMPGG